MVSLGKIPVVLATVSVLLLSMELNDVEAACDNDSLLNGIRPCISDLNQNPDPNGECCTSLRLMQQNLHPDEKCICDAMQNSAVVAAGLTKEKANTFITTCVGESAVPSCLR